MSTSILKTFAEVNTAPTKNLLIDSSKFSIKVYNSNNIENLLLSNSIVSVNIKELFPKLKEKNTPYGFISNSFVEFDTFDGFELDLMYRIDRGSVRQFTNLFQNYHPNNTVRLPAMRSTGTQFRIVLQLETASEPTRSITFQYSDCFVLSIISSPFSYNNVASQDVTVTINANSLVVS